MLIFIDELVTFIIIAALFYRESVQTDEVM